jgi:hypothetical protein
VREQVYIQPLPRARAHTHFRVLFISLSVNPPLTNVAENNSVVEKNLQPMLARTFMLISTNYSIAAYVYLEAELRGFGIKSQ